MTDLFLISGVNELVSHSSISIPASRYSGSLVGGWGVEAGVTNQAWARVHLGQLANVPQG